MRRDRITLLILFMLIVGRKGVAYIQLVPGFYFTEIFLLSALVRSKGPTFISALRKPPFIMVVVLFIYGLVLLLADLFMTGSISPAGLKNFALVYYPMASLIGYAWGESHRSWLAKGVWVSFLTILFLANGILSLAFPFAGLLGQLVWKVGGEVPILFTYSANTVFLPAGLFFFLLVREAPFFIRLFGVIVTLTGILLLMERSVFVSSFITLLIILYFSKRNELLRVAKYAGAALFGSFTALVFFSGFIESSRVEISLGGYLDLLLSIFIDTGNSSLSGTRGHRLEMWSGLISDLASSSSIFTYLFGKGFNIEIEGVLGITFRSPHNSLLHILWRTGILGLGIVLSILGLFMGSYIKILKSYNKINKDRYSIILWGFALLNLMLVDTMFGTLFESPFASAPLFFILGVCLTYRNSFQSLKNTRGSAGRGIRCD